MIIDKIIKNDDKLIQNKKSKLNKTKITIVVIFVAPLIQFDKFCHIMDL